MAEQMEGENIQTLRQERDRYEAALRCIVDNYRWGGGGHRGAYLTASRALNGA